MWGPLVGNLERGDRGPEKPPSPSTDARAFFGPCVCFIWKWSRRARLPGRYKAAVVTISQLWEDVRQSAVKDVSIRSAKGKYSIQGL